MAFLSKIELKQGVDLRALARAIPKNAYAEHQVIWALMAREREQSRDFLFRREHVGHWPVFYVLSSQSPTQPQDGPWSVHTKAFTPKLSASQRLGFVLRANPVRTTKASSEPADKRRQRHDVVMDAKRQEHAKVVEPAMRSSQAQLVQQAGPRWLEERAERAGFSLEALYVDDYHQHRLTKRGQQHPIRFSTVDYQGILRVLDTKRFIETLHRGIGPAKAFGCGLMLVRPV